MRVKAALGLVLSIAVLGACQVGGKSVDASRLQGADADAQNWMTTGRTYSEQRYSPLASITPDTAGKLGLAWHYEFDTDRGQEATPLEVDGTLSVVSSDGKIYRSKRHYRGLRLP